MVAAFPFVLCVCVCVHKGVGEGVGGWVSVFSVTQAVALVRLTDWWHKR